MLAPVMAERDRWPLWLPVFLGCGIALYFALPVEPPLWLGALALATCVLTAWLARRHWPVLLPALVVLFVALGFFAAELRAALVSAPVLERPSGQIRVEGRVEEVEPLAGGGQRVTLSELVLDLDGVKPERVRLKLKTETPVHVGTRIGLNAVLLPPPQPAAPGAFDFARFAFFMGLGAIGSGMGEPQVLPGEGGSGVMLWLNQLRHRITLRIIQSLPADGTGAVAAALVAGETASIPRNVMDDYRDSGLAHILSISGLHMSMAAGLVFFIVRGGLALIPAIALRYPIKKWAAVVALGTTFFYMMLAGAPVPAVRSFLMTGIVLVAVLLDRVALSMRMVAWAATIVLLVAPDALIGPSFQMSFAAVAALISVYEVLTPRMAAWRMENRGWVAGSGHYLFGVVLTTLVAGTATAIYGAYHFNRFAVWSVVSNALAVPLSGLAMPFAMAGLLLMPLGWDEIAWVPMGWCVAGVNWVANMVAHWPAAAITLPVLPLWGMVMFTLGGAWLLLWRRLWRLWGLLPMAVGLASMAFAQPPDILVDSRGYSLGVRTAEGSLLVNRGGRILRETWMRRAGPEARERWPKKGRSNDGRLSCDPLGCLYRVDGAQLSLVQDDGGVDAACAGSGVVVSAVPIRHACRGPKLVIDRFDLWRRGGHALWLTPNGARVETVAQWQGDRPWAHKPHRKKVPRVAVTAEPEEPVLEMGAGEEE
ncbi:MAG: ComEC/Rec2 family competence protein [Rhodospirillaceae bacterium]|nr:ComEC/Rec2 family competence protein [Rhodospirillales bacterium]